MTEKEFKKKVDKTLKAASKEQLRTWRSARIENYAASRPPLVLAQMIVELEDKFGVVPEFDITDAWPDRIKHLQKALSK